VINFVKRDQDTVQ